MNIIDLTRKGGANMKIKKVKTNGGLNVIHRCQCERILTEIALIISKMNKGYFYRKIQEQKE